MTREQFIDGLRDILDNCFPDEQSRFQISKDDVSAVQNALVEFCRTIEEEVNHEV